jgi:tRNA ligase
LEQGSGEGTGIGELVIEGSPLVEGEVMGVLSR